MKTWAKHELELSSTFCLGCGSPKVVLTRRLTQYCQFCVDVLWHELKTRTDAVSEHGPYHKDNRGPKFLAIYLTPEATLGYGLYIARTPGEAMAEAVRAGVCNNWLLLRVDIQRSLTDIYRHPSYRAAFPYCRDKGSLPYDAARYGAIPPLLQESVA